MDLAQAKLLFGQLLEMRFHNGPKTYDVFATLEEELTTIADGKLDAVTKIGQYGNPDIEASLELLIEALEDFKDHDCDLSQISRVSKGAFENASTVINNLVCHEKVVIKFYDDNKDADPDAAELVEGHKEFAKALKGLDELIMKIGKNLGLNMNVAQL